MVRARIYTMQGPDANTGHLFYHVLSGQRILCPESTHLTTSYVQAQQQSAAAIMLQDFAFLPAVPLNTHGHVVGALTAFPAKPLPEPLMPTLGLKLIIIA